LYPNPKFISQIEGGSISIMSKPSGGEYLEDDIKFLKNVGIDIIVSLLEPRESSELGLSEEENCCASLGIRYVNLPIQDRSIPPNNAKFIESVHDVYDFILSGSNVVAHCRAGIGRSGIYTTSVLIRHGLSAQEAFKLVSAARGFEIPDTQEQIEWIHENENQIKITA